jgi:hypothetical protein
VTIREFSGLKRETACSCGCGKRMPANEDVRVMVDLDSTPRKKYIPGHEPRERKAGAEPSPQPPAPQAPAPAAPQPTVDPSPTPNPRPSGPGARHAPEGSLGTTSLADNRPWAIVQVTASVGPYESVKVGMADFSGEGEDLTALRARIAREVSEEMGRQVAALRCLHNGHGTNGARGAAPPGTNQRFVSAETSEARQRAAPPTPSPAPAGAPPAPVRPAPAGSAAEALGRYYGARW